MSPRKRAKRPKYEQPSKSIPSDALMTAAYVGDTSSLFFRLPLELRNRIYDALWQGDKTIAVVQHSSKIDIRPYFDDDDVLERDDRFGRYRTYQEAQQHSSLKHQQPTAPLPDWLLTSKLFFREAMARFDFESHWLLRLMSRAGPYMPLPTTTAMVPGLAKSLSLGEWSFERSLSLDTPRQRGITEITVRFGNSDINWLNNLAEYLDEHNQVQCISLGIVHPSFDEMQGLYATSDMAPIE